MAQMQRIKKYMISSENQKPNFETLNAKDLTLDIKKINELRPKDSLFGLTKWVDANFTQLLLNNLCAYKQKKASFNTYINNKIMVNDSFLSYCKQSDISIKCLYKDPVISWKESEKERFLSQGVFLVSGKNFHFLQCSLFYNTPKNEDEVGFFGVVPDECYDEYIKFKDNFDNWSNFLDKDNLHVRVVGGEDIPYDRESSWDDLFLPEETKNDIKFTVESFLTNKSFYEKNKINWKRGLLLHGPQGCGKTSIIKTIISNYNIKPVTVTANPNDELLTEAFNYAQSQTPSLLYFEDLDSTFNNVDMSYFLNLIDGISAKNGLLLIASANDISKFRSSITDRPSRFDRKIEVPLPSLTMVNKYIERYFGSITKKDVKEISMACDKNKLSYAHLKELYVSSIFTALSKNTDKPTRSDIDLALKQILADKPSRKSNVSLDKYMDKE